MLNEPFIALGRFVHRYYWRALFCAWGIAGISAISDWLWGGIAALVAGRTQFISVAIMIYGAVVYLSFEPLENVDQVYPLARLSRWLKNSILFLGGAMTCLIVGSTIVEIIHSVMASMA